MPRLLAALLFALPLALHAQAWPQRAIKMMIPFPPAGATDIVGRIVALKLQEALGQQVCQRPLASHAAAELAVVVVAAAHLLEQRLYGVAASCECVPLLLKRSGRLG